MNDTAEVTRLLYHNDRLKELVDRLEFEKKDLLEHIANLEGALAKRKGYTKWTKKKLQELALQYKHRSDFKAACISAYKVACRYKLLDEICSHMTPKKRRDR